MVLLVSAWPFDQWGIDIVGPLPMAKEGKRFVAVAMDYFTKWAEAEALSKIGEKEMKDFVWKSIVCIFGISRVLIYDNETQFKGRDFQGFCFELKI